MTDRTPQAVQACHELIRWMIPQLDKFPRLRRFTLGERLESALLQVLELLVEAAYTRNKQAALQRANLRLEVVRHLWRLAHELEAVSTRPYGHGAELMDALGRQIGGWLRRRSPDGAKRNPGHTQPFASAFGMPPFPYSAGVYTGYAVIDGDACPISPVPSASARSLTDP